MKTKRLIFVFGIFLIALACISVMNINYNRLSRYFYIDYMSDQEVALLDEHLNDREIEYIIEYSIAPYYLYDYVQSNKFNIYNIVQYHELSEYHAHLSGDEIVELISATKNNMEVHELASWLSSYDVASVLFYLENGDLYNEDSNVIRKPQVDSTFLNIDTTVSKRVPYPLKTLNEVPTTKDNIKVLSLIIDPLQNLCDAIEEDNVNPLPCAALSVTSGYISYDEQIILYEEALLNYGENVLFYQDYPGHDDAQLGWSVNFAVTGIVQRNFDLTVQYRWLEENAHLYGFIELYKEDDELTNNHVAEPYYWRYVGIQKATQMFEEDLSYFE